jgi:hypothetical protein
VRFSHKLFQTQWLRPFFHIIIRQLQCHSIFCILHVLWRKPDMEKCYGEKPDMEKCYGEKPDMEKCYGEKLIWRNVMV